MDSRNVSPDFLKISSLKQFTQEVAAGNHLLVEELWDSPKALLLSAAKHATNKHIIVITGGVRESRLFDDFLFFLVFLFSFRFLMANQR